jgi:hypothetical protein
MLLSHEDSSYRFANDTRQTLRDILQRLDCAIRVFDSLQTIISHDQSEMYIILDHNPSNNNFIDTYRLSREIFYIEDQIQNDLKPKTRLLRANIISKISNYN